MATTTEIPVHFTPEAVARIAQLGIEREVQLMIEHTRQSISGLESIDVETWDDESEPGESHLTINAWRPGTSKSLLDYAPKDEWVRWFLDTFPPDVLRWLSFDLYFREEHGR